MKWPNSVTLIRHDKSAYNALKATREQNPQYQEFKNLFDTFGPEDQRVKEMAASLRDRIALGVGDWNTKLYEGAGEDSKRVGCTLRSLSSRLPDVVYVSPYIRTLDTLSWLRQGWPELEAVPTFEDGRLRELEHGLLLLYNDRRLFYAFHPEQHKLHHLEGPYWYRYPQGENVEDVRERNRSFLGMLIREHAEEDVLVVSHHLNILAMRANLERWDAAVFNAIDQEDKPINCGVTLYKGDPHLGRDGRLLLEWYNQKLY